MNIQLVHHARPRARRELGGKCLSKKSMCNICLGKELGKGVLHL